MNRQANNTTPPSAATQHEPIFHLWRLPPTAPPSWSIQLAVLCSPPAPRRPTVSQQKAWLHCSTVGSPLVRTLPQSTGSRISPPLELAPKQTEIHSAWLFSFHVIFIFLNFGQVSGRRRRPHRHGTPSLCPAWIQSFSTPWTWKWLSITAFDVSNSFWGSDFVSFNADTVRTVIQTVVSVTEKLDGLLPSFGLAAAKHNLQSRPLLLNQRQLWERKPFVVFLFFRESKILILEKSNKIFN